MPPETAAQRTAHLTPAITLEPAISAWEVFLNDQGRSIHTIKAFAADLRLLAGYLPPDRPLGSITTPELNQFLDWMQKGRGVPCSPKTLARRITSIKAFFRWLHERGVLPVDPAERVVQRSVISPAPVVLTGPETVQVLEAAARFRQAARPDARYYALVSLLLTTGIKKGECLTLTVNHIDSENPKGPHLFVRYGSPQHRYKERRVPLTEDWLQAYREYAAQYAISERLFPWSQRRLEYLLEDLGKEAGLEKHLSFDMCRWTCALQDWKDGVDPNKIRQKLGISKIQWREVRMKLGQLAGQDSG
jgi:integrase/recombinase XerD